MSNSEYFAIVTLSVIRGLYRTRLIVADQVLGEDAQYESRRFNRDLALSWVCGGHIFVVMHGQESMYGIHCQSKIQNSQCNRLTSTNIRHLRHWKAIHRSRREATIHQLNDKKVVSKVPAYKRQVFTFRTFVSTNYHVDRTKVPAPVPRGNQMSWRSQCNFL